MLNIFKLFSYNSDGKLFQVQHYQQCDANLVSPYTLLSSYVKAKFQGFEILNHDSSSSGLLNSLLIAHSKALRWSLCSGDFCNV